MSLEAVIEPLLGWLAEGRRPVLATVIETWGSSPRPAGSCLAIGYGGTVIGTGAQGMKKVANTATAGNKPLTAASAPPTYRLWLQNFQR